MLQNHRPFCMGMVWDEILVQAILPLPFRENLLGRRGVFPFPVFRTGYAPSYLHIHATELLVSNYASLRCITHWHCRSIDFKIQPRRGQNRLLYNVNVNIRLRDNLVTQPITHCIDEFIRSPNINGHSCDRAQCLQTVWQYLCRGNCREI